MEHDLEDLDAASQPVYKVGCDFNGEEKLAMLKLSILQVLRRCLWDFGAFQGADADLMTVEMSQAMLTAYVLGLPDKPQKSKLVASPGGGKRTAILLWRTRRSTRRPGCFCASLHTLHV